MSVFRLVLFKTFFCYFVTYSCVTIVACLHTHIGNECIVPDALSDHVTDNDALYVALRRVTDNKHHMADVIVGWLIGAGIAVFVVSTCEALKFFASSFL